MPSDPRARRRRRLHAAVVAAATLPALWLLAEALLGRLGANPVETITHSTGSWALRFLVACLAVSPLRRWLRMPALAPYRRSFGLLAFGYAGLHFATFLVLDLELDWGTLVGEVVERPYVSAGFAAFSLLVPLAATSTRAMARRLGRRWKSLHRLVYVAALLAVVHFLWLVKADLREPAIYAAAVAGLLGLRAAGWARRRARSGPGTLPACPNP